VRVEIERPRPRLLAEVRELPEQRRLPAAADPEDVEHGEGRLPAGKGLLEQPPLLLPADQHPVPLQAEAAGLS